MSIITDNTVLVHIYSCLESQNKISLGLLVALTAEKNDHKVTLFLAGDGVCLLYTSPSPRDRTRSRMPSSA